METSGKDLESQRRAMIVQQKIKKLEQENNIYKQRLLELSHFAGIKSELDNYLRRNDIRNILEVPPSTSISSSSDLSIKSNSTQVNGSSNKLVDFTSENTNGNGVLQFIFVSSFTAVFVAPPVPPRQFENTPAVGTKLEGLLLNEFEQDNDFDPRSFENNSVVNGNNTPNPPLRKYSIEKLNGVVLIERTFSSSTTKSSETHKCK